MIGSGIDRPLSLLGVDMDRPNAARMHDYWLGGSHNFAADRELCNRIADVLPAGRDGIRSNRAFLRRVVQFLVTERGVTQFLDLGSGIPTAGNVHEVAQRADPEARVVYVDADPIAVAHARHILAGNDHCAAVHADLRRPDDVLGRQELLGVLDLTRPIAVTMFSVLGFVSDADRPVGVVRRYLSRLVSGSHLAVSQSAEYDLARGADAGAARVPDRHRRTADEPDASGRRRVLPRPRPVRARRGARRPLAPRRADPGAGHPVLRRGRAQGPLRSRPRADH